MLCSALQCRSWAQKFRCIPGPETWRLALIRQPQCLLKPANLQCWCHILEQAISRTTREAIKMSESACRSLGGSMPRIRPATHKLLI